MSEQKNIGIDRPSFLQRLVKQKMALVGGIVILLWLLVAWCRFSIRPTGPMRSIWRKSSWPPARAI